VTTGELSYSQSSHNPMLRGTIPLALAALNIDYSRREFILDSGADIWHLKASNESEFEIWKTRLEDVWLKAVAGRQKSLQDQQDGTEITSEWKQVEGLVERLEMMKEFVSGMVKDISNENNKSTPSLLTLKKSVDNLRDTSATKNKDAKERIKIFRKKDKQTPPPSPSRELSSNTVNQVHGITLLKFVDIIDQFLHDSITPKLTSLDQNLESILASFQNILSTLRLQGTNIPTISARRTSFQSRISLDSNADDWFDARSITNPPEEGLITVVEQETESDHRPDETTEDEDDLEQLRAGAISPLLTMVPKRSRSGLKKELYPLGEWRGRVVKRRKTLPAQVTIPPPSLLSFLRKNVFPFKRSLY
jgi:oxysterol-binding protein-related protein 3/6/7